MSSQKVVFSLTLALLLGGKPFHSGGIPTDNIGYSNDGIGGRGPHQSEEESLTSPAMAVAAPRGASAPRNAGNSLIKKISAKIKDISWGQNSSKACS